MSPNAEENIEVEQHSSNEEARLEEEEMTEPEEESLNERSVPSEVIENQSERERRMEQDFVLPTVYTRISYHWRTVPGENVLYTVHPERLAEQKLADIEIVLK